MSTNTPWPVKVQRGIFWAKVREAALAVLVVALIAALVVFALTGCIARSSWVPPTGSTLTDCERVMGRPATISGNEARWFLPNGTLEAYAEFDKCLWIRGVIVLEDGKFRQRHDFEVPRTVAPLEWYGEAYNSMEPKP